MTSCRELVAVPDLEIEMVRALTQSGASYEHGPFPVIGERVRIHGGCLQGVEGILVDQTGREEIVITVGAIQRSLKVLARALSGRAPVPSGSFGCLTCAGTGSHIPVTAQLETGPC